MLLMQAMIIIYISNLVIPKNNSQGTQFNTFRSTDVMDLERLVFFYKFAF